MPFVKNQFQTKKTPKMRSGSVWAHLVYHAENTSPLYPDIGVTCSNNPPLFSDTGVTCSDNLPIISSNGCNVLKQPPHYILTLVYHTKTTFPLYPETGVFSSNNLPLYPTISATCSNNLPIIY